MTRLQVRYLDTGLAEYDVEDTEALAIMSIAQFLGAAIRWWSETLNDWTRWF